MTKPEPTAAVALSKAALLADPDFLKEIVRSTLQEVLEAEMTDALGAAKGERSEARRGYRSGSYPRTLVTRVGRLELRVPQDRDGRFSTELFARYQRSEQALVASLAEMYVQGVSTRKVKAITEELCGHAFSASSISEINKGLDARLAAFATRRLEEAFPYLILDARYERVREGGVVRIQAVHVAIGIDWEGRRQILAVELFARESRSSWGDFLRGLLARGLRGVELVVADDHAGLRAAIRETLPEAAYQRCYVHFLRNALDHLPRKADDAACRSCAGSTTAATSPRRAPTSPPGSPSGRPATPASPPGSRRRSRRPSPFTGFLAATTNTSRAPTCSSASTRRSSAAPGSCASFPTPKAAFASSAPSPSRATRTGSRPAATSTWTTFGSRRSSP